MRVSHNIGKQTCLHQSRLHLSVNLGTKVLIYQRTQDLCHFKLDPSFPEKLL